MLSLSSALWVFMAYLLVDITYNIRGETVIKGFVISSGDYVACFVQDIKDMFLAVWTDPVKCLTTGAALIYGTGKKKINRLMRMTFQLIWILSVGL
jgi:hypothetical protein